MLCTYDEQLKNKETAKELPRINTQVKGCRNSARHRAAYTFVEKSYSMRAALRPYAVRG